MVKNFKTANPRYWLRLTAGFAAGLIIVALILLAMLIIPVIPDPSDNFINRKGHLLSISQTRQWYDKDSVFTELSLLSTSGLQVELSIRSPKKIHTPRPLVLLLGGQRTGRDANQLINDSHGLVLAAISYSYNLESGISTLELLRRLPDIQQAIIDATPSVLLATDYLLSQSYIDSEHVELVGVSLGAFLVSASAAIDSRFKRTWLIHGSAEPDKVFEHMLKDEIECPPLRTLLGKFFATVVASHHLKPEKWLAKISPRPVIIINASNDEILPQQSIKRLHQSVSEPAEHIWMGGRHLKPYRTDIINQLETEILARIAKEAQNDN